MKIPTDEIQTRDGLRCICDRVIIINAARGRDKCAICPRCFSSVYYKGDYDPSKVHGGDDRIGYAYNNILGEEMKIEKERVIYK